MDQTKQIIDIQPLRFPWQTNDPFLFCAYHRDVYPEGNEQMEVDPTFLTGRQIGQDFSSNAEWRMYHGRQVPGFPYHPHRGFETVTINMEGYVDHSDSLGAAGRFGAGDVQWMTAGKGVLHSEMFPLLHSDKQNPLEIFQVWLNLPARTKMVEPHFKMLWRDEIPVIHQNTDSGASTEIKLIAGSFEGKQAPAPTPDSWAADPSNGILILTIHLPKGGALQLPPHANDEVNRTLYFYKGDTIKVKETTVSANHLIHLYPEAAVTIENQGSDAYFLLLQGRPIGEPVAQHGPFVMNTQEEIQQAFAEYRRTQFGGWPWPEQEQVHPRKKGRFALHADGTEELKTN